MENGNAPAKKQDAAELRTELKWTSRCFSRKCATSTTR
jgi:hypothetical protein